jgi:divalent metal cation (Fe/Co/Zn/Cd) transporter
LETAKQNLRLQKIITGVGIILFSIKVVAWWLTGSVAILTDALESTVNIVAGMIGIYSLFVSAKPKDQDHPYGHGILMDMGRPNFYRRRSRVPS